MQAAIAFVTQASLAGLQPLTPLVPTAAHDDILNQLGLHLPPPDAAMAPVPGSAYDVTYAAYPAAIFTDGRTPAPAAMPSVDEHGQCWSPLPSAGATLDATAPVSGPVVPSPHDLTAARPSPSATNTTSTTTSDSSCGSSSNASRSTSATSFGSSVASHSTLASPAFATAEKDLRVVHKPNMSELTDLLSDLNMGPTTAPSPSPSVANQAQLPTACFICESADDVSPSSLPTVTCARLHPDKPVCTACLADYARMTIVVGGVCDVRCPYAACGERLSLAEVSRACEGEPGVWLRFVGLMREGEARGVGS